MPPNEKEYNGNLFDQLTLLERIEEVALETKDEKVLKLIAKLKKKSNESFINSPH